MTPLILIALLGTMLCLAGAAGAETGNTGMKEGENEAGRHLNKSLSCLENRSFAPALSHADRAVAQDPDNATAHGIRGVALYASHRPEQAVLAFDRALELAPGNVTALFNRGLSRMGLGEWEKACQDFSAALDRSPGNWQILAARGLARYGSQGYAKALADSARAMELAPDVPETLNQMAWMLSVCPDAGLRNGTLAVTLAVKALGLMPDPEILDTLSLAYAESGNFKRALACQKKRVRLLADSDTAPSGEKLEAFYRQKPWRVSSLPAAALTVRVLPGG